MSRPDRQREADVFKLSPLALTGSGCQAQLGAPFGNRGLSLQLWKTCFISHDCLLMFLHMVFLPLYGTNVRVMKRIAKSEGKERVSKKN